MKHETIQEFIEIAKEKAPNDECRALILDFEAMAELREKLEQSPNNLGVLSAFKQKQQQFWVSLEKLLPSFGLTPEMVKAYIENPAAFTSKLPEEIQTILNGGN